jgi:hypothetical protein
MPAVCRPLLLAPVAAAAAAVANAKIELMW